MKFTKQQAFAAMQHFLNNYYKQTLADDIGHICSGLALLDDNKPADQAFENDWLDSAKAVIPNYQENLLMPSLQAFMITKEFLALYCRIGYSQEVDELIKRMIIDKSGRILDADIGRWWDEGVRLGLEDGPLYFQLHQ